MLVKIVWCATNNGDAWIKLALQILRDPKKFISPSNDIETSSVTVNL